MFIPQDQTRQPDDDRRHQWISDVLEGAALILFFIAAFVFADVLSNKTDRAHVHAIFQQEK